MIWSHDQTKTFQRGWDQCVCVFHWGGWYSGPLLYCCVCVYWYSYVYLCLWCVCVFVALCVCVSEDLLSWLGFSFPPSTVLCCSNLSVLSVFISTRPCGCPPDDNHFLSPPVDHFLSSPCPPEDNLSPSAFTGLVPEHGFHTSLHTHTQTHARTHTEQVRIPGRHWAPSVFVRVVVQHDWTVGGRELVITDRVGLFLDPRDGVSQTHRAGAYLLFWVTLGDLVYKYTPRTWHWYVAGP